ncbi:ArnT family glycosyltransferase [Paludisphaera rhizosphaerae]|uniref:ArnT family glycosyltransferase n=1 Tax=Paludisphaera rhizosphaerae TaxID=2711216 RepID=UPI0013ED1234|nr:glycosyltransferase family 39 protein [Paludisphaera rhizosphaerae]
MSERGGKSWRERWGDPILGLLIASATLVLLIATLNDYGMAWDEGFTVEREERLREWFAKVGGAGSSVRHARAMSLSKLESRGSYLAKAGASASSPWSRESLRFYWPFAREEPNGHPPLYALLGLAGWAVSHDSLSPPGSYRLGPAALFAATVGVVYVFMARRYGRVAGLMASFGLVAMPRMFAHAHLASYDVPTLCFWFLAVVAFLKAVEPSPGNRWWLWTAAFGLAWGCGMATKFTGWFIPFPLIAWSLFYLDRRSVRVLALGGVVAALVVYATNPTWWAEPIQGLRAFLVSNLTRDQLRPIPTYFLGRLYRFSLPWYNTLVITAIVTPPLTLALALLGSARVVSGRFRDREGTLLFLCWVFFLVLRALPNAPGHDGERQFLTAFVFLACLSGIGLTALGEWIGRIPGLDRPALGRGCQAIALTAALALGGWSTWRYHPLQLSYFNALIGGLSGATRAGIEPTYYWEAVTPDVRDWLNTHTDEGRTIAFCFPAVTFEYLHDWGQLKPLPLILPATPPQWYVVMNRTGHLLFQSMSLPRFLLEHGKPAYVKFSSAAPDVPLVLIYSGVEVSAADLILKWSDGKQPNSAKDEHRSAPDLKTP